MLKTPNFNSQSGRTLFEMLAVIVVAGLVVGGVFTMAQQAFVKRDISNVLGKVQLYVTSIKQALSWVGTYNFGATSTEEVPFAALTQMKTTCSDISCYLREEKIIHEIDSNGQVHIGGVVIEFESGAMPNNIKGTFSIVIKNAKTPLCVALLTSDWGEDLYDWSVSLSGAAQDSFHQPGDFNMPPLSVSEAVNACPSSSYYTVKLKFK